MVEHVATGGTATLNVCCVRQQQCCEAPVQLLCSSVSLRSSDSSPFLDPQLQNMSAPAVRKEDWKSLQPFSPHTPMLAPFLSKVPEQTAAGLPPTFVELVEISVFWRRSVVREDVLSYGQRKSRVCHNPSTILSCNM